MHTEGEKASTPVEVPDLNPPRRSNRAERWRKILNLVVAALLGLWVLFRLIERFPQNPLPWWYYALLLLSAIGTWFYWYGRFWFLQWLLLRRWRAEPSLPFTRRPRFSRSRKAALVWGATLVLLSVLEEIEVEVGDVKFRPDFSLTSITTFSYYGPSSSYSDASGYHHSQVFDEGPGALAELGGRPINCHIQCSPSGATCEALREALKCELPDWNEFKDPKRAHVGIHIEHEGEGLYCLPYSGIGNFFRFRLEIYGSTTKGEVSRTIFREYTISSWRVSGSCRSLYEANGQMAARVIQQELKGAFSPELK